jgi:hypothetical protein
MKEKSATYDGAQRLPEDPQDFDVENKGGSRRWFTGRLFEPPCWVWMIPVLVVAVDRKINVKTIKDYISCCARFTESRKWYTLHLE